jgi:uncharacterized protein
MTAETTNLISIKLTPKASANRIGKTRKLPNGTEQLLIYVTDPPDKNKANDTMLQLLALHLNVPVSRLSIVRGQTSRNKLVCIK